MEIRFNPSLEVSIRRLKPNCNFPCDNLRAIYALFTGVLRDILFMTDEMPMRTQMEFHLFLTRKIRDE